MADLDNFFAKKDKKKLKGRKYDNPDDIAKRLKECEKKLEKEMFKIEPVKKTLDEVLSNTSGKNDSGNVAPEPKPEKQVEEEWKDFTDESQKDLTNLKISKLQIEDEEDGNMGYGSGEDDGGSGVGSKGDGVWSKNLDHSEHEQSNSEADIIVPSSKDDQKSQIGGSYIAPHLRKSSSASPLPKGNRKPKTAPDITSAMAFPSLSDSQTSTPVGAWGRKRMGEEKGFQNVKHGSSKSYSTEEHAPPRLSTANRFDALCDNS